MDGVVDGAVEEPAHQTEGEHVLRADNGFHVEAGVFEALFGERRQRYGHHLHRFRQVQLGEGVVGFVERFLQVFGGEGVGIADDYRVVVDVLHIHLQRSGIHSHKHIGLVAGRIDALTQLHLETAHAAECSLRRTYLRREVRQCRNLVAQNS